MIKRAVMLLSISFGVTTWADAQTGGAGYFSCTFDSGYLPRAEIKDGQGEICVPGHPVDCEPATRRSDKIVSEHWVLQIEGRGKCKVATAASTVQPASADGFRCTFPARNNGAVPEIKNGAYYSHFPNEPHPLPLRIYRTDAEGRMAVEAVMQDGTKVLGLTSKDGTMSIIKYLNGTAQAMVMQGKCTGTESYASAPVVPSPVPPELLTIYRFATGTRCVSSGMHTGVVGISGGAVDFADGSVESPVLVSPSELGTDYNTVLLPDHGVVGFVNVNDGRVVLVREADKNVSPISHVTDTCQ